MTNTSFALAIGLAPYLGLELTIDGLTSGQSVWYYADAAATQWLYATAYNAGIDEDWDLEIYLDENTRAYKAFSGNHIKYIGVVAQKRGRYYFRVYAAFVKARNSSCTFKAVISGGASGANSAYNRTAAQNYLYKYWETPNPAYPYFASDCANFVSQALHAGGMVKLGGASSRDKSSTWFMTLPFKPNNAYYSATWTGADYFTKHWGTNCHGQGFGRAYDCRYYIGQNLYDNFSEIAGALRPGDVIQLTRDNTTTRYHTLMVFENTGNDIKLSAHTYNTIDRSLFEEALIFPERIFCRYQNKKADSKRASIKKKPTPVGFFFIYRSSNSFLCALSTPSLRSLESSADIALRSTPR